MDTICDELILVVSQCLVQCRTTGLAEQREEWS